MTGRLNKDVEKLTQYRESALKLKQRTGDTPPDTNHAEAVASIMRMAEEPCIGEGIRSKLKTTLLTMNSDCHDGVVNPLDTLKASAKSLKTKEAWEVKLDEEEKKAKANADAAITKGFNRVRATVATLPPNQQVHAVDLFSEGEDIIGKWVGTISNVFGKLAETATLIVHDVEKVAEGVEHAISDVGSAVGDAAEAIGSLF